MNTEVLYRETTQDDEHPEKYNSKTMVLLTYANDDIGRPKTKSATEVTKLSRFGKNYNNNKELKSN